MSNEADEMWIMLKDLKHISSDGIFYCKNKEGRKVVVLYSKEDGVCMSCDTDDCDLGNEDNFKERH